MLVSTVLCLGFVRIPVMPSVLIVYIVFTTMFSPTSDGAGAAVLASEAFVTKHGLQAKAVEIIAQEMVTDLATTFDENSCIKMVSPGGGPSWIDGNNNKNKCKHYCRCR